MIVTAIALRAGVCCKPGFPGEGKVYLGCKGQQVPSTLALREPRNARKYRYYNNSSNVFDKRVIMISE